MSNIKNIIFDLGGVLLNLDIQRTQAAFREIGIFNINELIRLGHASSVFRDHELGSIDDDQFLMSLRKLVRSGVEDKQILDAWNAMLLDFSSERIQWLRQLKTKYRLFLFSNTNAIHWKIIQATYRATFGNGSLDDHFEKTYYSHLVKVRKPDAAAYELVIRENGLRARETLFIDDALVNVEAARKLGLYGLHLEPSGKISDLNLF